MLRRWFNGLRRDTRMMVRVVLCFFAAISIWDFYAHVTLEDAAFLDYFPFLLSGIFFFLLYVYLETGRRNREK